MIDRTVVTLNTAKELFGKASLDYNRLSIGYVDHIYFENYFDFTPEDYLLFAKKDLKQKDERGLINALSNAKRAIDCLIENTLKNFDINLKKIPQVALNFCEDALDDEYKSINPLSLRLFCALGLAPNLLVSEVRNLRNKIEHEFNNPKKEDVLRAYEVAELLINNVKAKEIYSCAIDISDFQRNGNSSFDKISGIRFNSTFGESKELGRFYLNFRDKPGTDFQYYLNQEDKMYYYFLKAMFIAEFDAEELVVCIKQIIREINPKLNLDDINVNIRNR